MTAQCSGRVRADTFSRFVSNVLPHAAKDEVLVMLTNIIVRHHFGGFLSVEASDAFTWARHKWECFGVCADDKLCATTEWTYAVNAKALADVAKQAKRVGGDVAFGSDEGVFRVLLSNAGSFTVPTVPNDVAESPLRMIDTVLGRKPGAVSEIGLMLEHLSKFAKYKHEGRLNYPLVFEFGETPTSVVVVTSQRQDDGFMAMVKPVSMEGR